MAPRRDRRESSSLSSTKRIFEMDCQVRRGRQSSSGTKLHVKRASLKLGRQSWVVVVFHVPNNQVSKRLVPVILSHGLTSKGRILHVFHLWKLNGAMTEALKPNL